jgi:hypothetical protein
VFAASKLVLLRQRRVASMLAMCTQRHVHRAPELVPLLQSPLCVTRESDAVSKLKASF